MWKYYKAVCCSLKITIKSNLQITDFLDATFKLKSGKFYPVRKSNSDPLYISPYTNHLKNIKQLLIRLASESQKYLVMMNMNMKK